MAKLLYIQASPRGERSKSVAVADAFADSYRTSHPDDEVDTLNVFEAELPAFDGPALNAKYAVLHGHEVTREMRSGWSAVEAVIERFTSADKYLLAVPMWNFAIPYRLKQYIDVLVQPGYTFSFDPEAGYGGLVTGRPACVVYASGGDYSGPEQAQMDMQKPYMKAILGFMGFEDIRSIVVAPTLAGGPEVAAERIAAAIDEAQRLASAF